MIRNLRGDGILFSPNTANPSQIFVSNTLVSDNGNEGINIFPTGTRTTTGVIDHVQMEDDGLGGLIVHTPSPTIKVTVTDSVTANNISSGISPIIPV